MAQQVTDSVRTAVAKKRKAHKIKPSTRLLLIAPPQVRVCYAMDENDSPTSGSGAPYGVKDGQPRGVRQSTGAVLCRCTGIDTTLVTVFGDANSIAVPGHEETLWSRRLNSTKTSARLHNSAQPSWLRQADSVPSCNHRQCLVT